MEGFQWRAGVQGAAQGWGWDGGVLLLVVVCAAGSHLEGGGVELPLLGDVQGGHGNTPGDEAVARGDGNGLERALDAVKDVVQDTGAQLDGERLHASGKVSG